jgi:ribosomal protein S18 acetylase RimI-like enzyme
MLKIEPYRAEFFNDLYQICLQTGAHGGDATPLYISPHALGDFFAVPYALHAPELTSVVTDAQGVCGYVLGTADSQAFEVFMNTVWLPPLRAKYAITAHTQSSEVWLLLSIAQGYKAPLDFPNFSDFPAHVHIDLLPRAQGQGMGRKLMETFLGQLQSLGVPGVHLGVSKQNTQALAFYRRMHFQTLAEDETGALLGMRLGTKLAPKKPE